jgi:hypothetical protein
LILGASKKWRRPSRRLLLSVAGVAAALALSACGDDEESGDEAAAEPQQIAITASEEGLEAPTSAESGLAEITLDNPTDAPHDAQLIRVEGDHDAQEAAEVIQSAQQGEGLPDWFFAGGGVGTVPPGETGAVTQTLEPGTYYAFDTEARGGPSEPPSIEVTGEPSDETVAADAPATITASEYAFETEGLSSDSPEVNFENAGEQPHHIVAAPLEEGATLEDVEAFARDESGPPPVNLDETISTAVVEGGDTQVVDLPFEQGDYALLCFISDREGGPPHVAEGMIAEAKVE